MLHLFNLPHYFLEYHLTIIGDAICFSLDNLVNISNIVKLVKFQFCLEKVLENQQDNCEVEVDVGESVEKTMEVVCQLVNTSIHSLIMAKIDRIYLFVGIFNSVLNPFIYAFWNPEFKAELEGMVRDLKNCFGFGQVNTGNGDLEEGPPGVNIDVYRI